jgi:hypothetical protein
MGIWGTTEPPSTLAWGITARALHGFYCDSFLQSQPKHGASSTCCCSVGLNVAGRGVHRLMRARQAKEEAERAAKGKEEELRGGNPLLAIGGDVTFNIKRRWDAAACMHMHAPTHVPWTACDIVLLRPVADAWAAAARKGAFCSQPSHSACRAPCARCRWDDDVVFKNQARSEPKAQKRFVNDTIRNDFHKRFLQRYIR